MSNKLIVNRLKGVISEYITLDEFTQSQVKKTQEYKVFLEKCQSEKLSFESVKKEIEDYLKAGGNFEFLKDDVFLQACRVVEVSKILEMLGEDVQLTDIEMQVLDACKMFTKPTFYIDGGEVKIQSNEFKEQLKTLSEQLNSKNNDIQEEYEMMINS